MTAGPAGSAPDPPELPGQGARFDLADAAVARAAVATLEARRRARENPPTHLLAEPGDRRALCGAKDAVPRVWIRYAAAHVDAYGMVVCPACQAAQ